MATLTTRRLADSDDAHFLRQRLTERGHGDRADAIIEAAGAARQQAEIAFRAWRAELDRRLAEFPALPPVELRQAKVAYTYRPTKAQGRAMAMDMGFDPHIAGMQIVVPDEADRLAADAEFQAGLRAESVEYARRSALVLAAMAADGLVQPRLSGCYSLTFFLSAAERCLCGLKAE